MLPVLTYSETVEPEGKVWLIIQASVPEQYYHSYYDDDGDNDYDEDLQPTSWDEYAYSRSSSRVLEVPVCGKSRRQHLHGVRPWHFVLHFPGLQKFRS